MIEVVAPVLVFVVALLAWHRSPSRTRVLKGPWRRVLAVVSLVIGALMYWALISWAISVIYPRVATSLGNAALGAAWDIRLTYTLPLTFLLLLALVCSYVIYLSRVGN